MSDQCHICGPNKKECPTAICAPCALRPTIEFTREQCINAQHKQERAAVESGWVELT